tara:strand:+ start:230 stop:547 length:318 start_codon:yes stop_codon:yes gene_type:complete
MCGGGGSDNSQAREDAEKRHQENLALQKEQMAEQKRQFELSREENLRRYEKQEKQADAPPPPPPEKTAQVAAPALDQLRIGDRRQYVTQAKKQSKRHKTGLGIVT